MDINCIRELICTCTLYIYIISMYVCVCLSLLGVVCSKERISELWQNEKGLQKESYE